MYEINCFVQIQESSDPFKPALDADDQYEHVDRLVLKRVCQIKNEYGVFVEQNMSQKLKFHQKEGVKFIIVFCNREVSSIERKKCNSARPWSFSKAKPWLGLLQKKYEGVQQ
jgi:hypothetical protein